MRHAGFLTLLGVSLFASTAAHAQSAAPACELHVWPTASFSANVQRGLLGDSAVGRLLHPGANKPGATQLTSGLDADGQIAILKAMDLPAMLGMSPATVTFHTPDDIQPGKFPVSRHTPSQSKCYGELSINQIIFEQHPLIGRRLLITFEYDDFYGQIQRRWMAVQQIETKLEHFPPAEGEDITAAANELTGVFKDDAEKFTAHVAKKRKNDKQP